MDGSQEYSSYISLFSLEDFSLEKANVPYCLMVNNFENISIYPYFNSIVSKEKYMFRMPYLTHNGFVSYWTFFDQCSTESTKNPMSISYNYICKYALAFFNDYLKKKSSSNQIMESSFTKNEYVEPYIQDNGSMAYLCNTILAYNIDSANHVLNQNNDIYYSKEEEINILGKMFIDNTIETAIQLFSYNSRLHPESWQAHFNLGWAYKEDGEIALARKYLSKAQELNPDNNDITRLLNEVSNNK
jgi:tetratricopeptide (TPR) repeat protein